MDVTNHACLFKSVFQLGQRKFKLSAIIGLIVSDSAHTSFCAVKLKQSTGGGRGTKFPLQEGFKRMMQVIGTFTSVPH